MKIKRFELNNIREVILQIGDKNCMQFLERDENDKLIPHPNGGYKIIEDKIEECNKTIEEILNTEIEINDIEFTLDELEGLDLSLAQIEAMMAVIKED